MNLRLRNPHSVAAVLDTRPLDVLEIRVTGKFGNNAWGQVIEEAKRLKIPVTRSEPSVSRGKGHDRDPGRRSATVEATVKPRGSVPLGSFFKCDEPDGLWLALDHVQDPHNVGAIFRAAAFWGVRGVLITKDQAAPMNDAVYDVASGGLEHVPVCVVNNLVRGLKTAKAADVWVLGASEHADKDVSHVDRSRRWLMVVGNEEKGLRRLTLQNCDVVVGMQPRGPITSLNVSVAVGSMLALLRQPIAPALD